MYLESLSLVMCNSSGLKHYIGLNGTVSPIMSIYVIMVNNCHIEDMQANSSKVADSIYQLFKCVL